MSDKKRFPFITLLIFSFLIASNTGVADERTAILTIQGYGKVLVTPDIAYIDFSIETVSPKASAAVKKNSVKANKVLSFLKPAIGKKGKIKSTSYTLLPVYEYLKHEGKSIITGYKAVNSFEIETQDLRKLGYIIDSITENGVNIIHGPYFDTTKRAKYRRKALEMAVKDAYKTAEAISNAAGIKIVGIKEIKPYYRTVFPKKNSSDQVISVLEQNKPTPVEKGYLSVEANVTIVYEIK